MVCLIVQGQVRAPRSFDREQLTEAHLPLLRLLANHVKSTLESYELMTRLREGSRKLAFANSRLTDSLMTLEEAQQQLLQGQKMEAIGRLAGGVAHDFNNLLTVIIGHARFVEDGLPDGSSLRADAAAITEAADRAARITSQLLAFSRKQKRSPQVVDLNALVKQSGGLLCRLIGEHILLRVRTEATESTVRADPGQLEQIILNLVVNARDAMPRGGTCTIETRTDERIAHPECPLQVTLIVSDTGAGMDSVTRARVFEPFFTTKDLGHGTGLGLATVYGLVEQNEGTIEVTSQVGRGSMFTISFPVVDSVPAPSIPPVTVVGVNVRAVILLVEDESSIRDLASRMLRGAGYTVFEAKDGEDALTVLEQAQTPVDLVVTDIVMPRMGGIELAHLVRKTHADMRFLFVSGYTFAAPDLAELGMFLQKPFTPSVLLDRVREVLAGPGSPNT